VSRRTTRRPGRRRPAGQHPSLWFFIILGIGIVLVVWVMAHVVTRPVTPPAKTTTAPAK
jgi:uncharacterized membrane protein